MGPTSFSVVKSVRKIIGAKKAGHIGTLDPAAEGVLPICLNRSTKITQFLTHLEKEYRATMMLGIETDSQDAQGKIIEEISIRVGSKRRHPVRPFLPNREPWRGKACRDECTQN